MLQKRIPKKNINGNKIFTNMIIINFHNFV